MALRAGHHWLRRVSRLFASDSISRGASTSDLAASHSAITVPRAPAPGTTFEPRLPNSNTRSSNLSQFRSLCSAPRDVDPGNSSVSVQESSSDSAVTKSEEEQETYKPSKRHDLAMLFTCKVCETRSAKTMSRATYETGIVIVRCPKCRNLHLIADRLGWFGEPGSVEDFLQHQGVSGRKGMEASYEFSVEDLAGWTPPSNESKD